MQMVSEVMTRSVQFISPQENIQRAAQMMDELNVGALPVCDGERLVGMVTDRDITVRAIAAGIGPADASVEDVMSTDVRWCFEDQPLDDVMQQMADTQIRRVPVVSHDDAHRLVGIVSLGDIATKASDAGQVVKQVSTPSEPDRSGPRSGVAGGAASGVSSATGSNTGTATGFAGTDALLATGHDAAGEEALDAPGTPDTSAIARPRSAEGTAGNRENTGESGAPGGTDATGVSGASGGTAGTAGTGGSAGGASP